MADKKKSIIPTIILTIISIIWIYPIVMILFNSLKVESAITTSGVFQLPTSETWNGIQNFVASVTQMDFLKSFLVQPCNFCNVCCFDPAVLLHVRMVHCSCKRNTLQGSVLPLRIQYGCSFPDGYVYAGKNSGYTSSEQPVHHLHRLPWIWCRTCCIYVYRICKRKPS